MPEARSGRRETSAVMVKKRPIRASADRAIGEGYILEESGLLAPTKRLDERRAVERLLEYWNGSEKAQWKITQRPDDTIRGRPAADFFCGDQTTGQTALIDVTVPGLTEHFNAQSAQGAEEISFHPADIGKNIRRLLKKKNQQLAYTANRHCVLIVWEGSAMDPFYQLFSAEISKIDLNEYQNIDEVYVAPDDSSAPVSRMLPP